MGSVNLQVVPHRILPLVFFIVCTYSQGFSLIHTNDSITKEMPPNFHVTYVKFMHLHRTFLLFVQQKEPQNNGPCR